MTARILSLHARYKSLQADADLAREKFYAVVREALRSLPVRETAKKLDVSPAYFGDVKAGRRGVSDVMLRKLEGLGK